MHLASETTWSCVSVHPQGLLQSVLGTAAKVFLSGTRGILIAKPRYRSLSTACMLFIRNIAIGPLLNSVAYRKAWDISGQFWVWFTL